MNGQEQNPQCAVCGSENEIFRCSRCRSIWYCGKNHQKQDWRNHRKFCVKSNTTILGSSEQEILRADVESLSPMIDNAMLANTANVSGAHTGNFKCQDAKLYDEVLLGEMSQNLIQDMDCYGVCVVNHFLGESLGNAVQEEVLNMHQTGMFKDGQLVSNRGLHDNKIIRSDQIVWIDGKEEFCPNIGILIGQVDALIMRANRMANNGKIGQYIIKGRTKAMVACYPGHGSHYVKHVDNPNRDGRCITAIYYLNRDWDVRTNGGLLRIFPHDQDMVADIEPLFDRLLLFWSDRRNPHEVQPAKNTRYAITLWYFDAVEREEAMDRFNAS